LGRAGVETREQIRRHPPLAQVPIIALTALASPDPAAEDDDWVGQEPPSPQVGEAWAGAQAYLTKPIKLKQLADLLTTLLAG
jgi:CheY-like chemotaxis protein